MMREQMQTRLEELRAELNAGNRRLQELDAEQTQLREVMLRISGAMQVLTELLESEAPTTDERSEPVAAAETNGHARPVQSPAASVRQ